MSVKTYAKAINEAHRQLLASDPRVFVIGQGSESPWFVGTTTVGLIETFGDERVIDTPISELVVTGSAIGAAMSGMRPIVFHPRLDFMYLAMDPIINHCAIWHYMFGGQVNVPVTIRGIVNRGGEQAAQHSQSPFAMYAHVPGIKIVCPASPYDAKGLLVAAVQDDNPVLYCDDRWLYALEEEVPDEIYSVPIGKGRRCCEGKDISLVTYSYLVPHAVQAAKELAQDGMSVDVIDLRSLRPMDYELIFESVEKTGRLVVADPEWPVCSIGDHVTSVVSRQCFSALKVPIEQINFPDCPVPASTPLEKAFFPGKEELIHACRRLINK